MIARTLVFSSHGHLSVRNRQLVYQTEQAEPRTFPIEDVGFVLIESEAITITAYALRELAEANVAVIVCDQLHLPVGCLQPYAAHSTTQETVSAQLSASDAVQGRLWRQIVQQKIINQANLMTRLQANGVKRLHTLAESVKNYDSTNAEAQAARIYFQALLPPDVTRSPEGAWPNCALNYGYAILRAAVARALIGSGLLCIRGIHHHNRYNAYCLADDIMEPYRPFVDQYVLGHVPPFDVSSPRLEKEHRVRLLQMLTCDVKLGEVRRPLMVALSYTTASLARHYLNKEPILLPELTP